jgi:TetR/AcrR family transcriptional regulator, transcriptional repressor for nem operon
VRGKRDGDTAGRVLDAAEALVQTRGFNGFSYAHVAGELGITTAGLHYHYGGKAALGEALIERYSGRFQDALADVEASGGSPRAQLDRYSDLYAQVLRSGRMCLCGILAAEYQTLPAPMRDSIVRFFDANLTWLSSVLARGRADGTLAFAGEPRDAAQALLAGLEGAMLLARPYGDPERFDAAARRMLDALAA